MSVKRSLEELYNNKNVKIVNFQKPTNVENKEIKKTNEEEIKEINNILNEIFEEDNIDVVIKVNSKNQEIYVNEYNEIGEKTRKYKYTEDNLKVLLDSIYDNYMYKEIHSFLLYLDDTNIFAYKENWATQLLNEIEHINILKKEKQEDDEFINLLESKLRL